MKYSLSEMKMTVDGINNLIIFQQIFAEVHRRDNAVLESRMLSSVSFTFEGSFCSQ